MTDSNKPDHAEDSTGRDFATEAEQQQVGIIEEFWDFLLHNKKWWITPIFVVLLLAGLLFVLGGTAAAPFIYTLF